MPNSVAVLTPSLSISIETKSTSGISSDIYKTLGVS
jgi:hypothetical protein